MTTPNHSNIDFVISTIDRPGNYLHSMLPHLRRDLRLRLVVGSPTYDYLERYRQNPLIEIIGIDLREWDRIKDCPVLYRALWNYWRCLTLGAKTEHRKGLLILEDDVLPTKGWERRLYQTIEHIELQYGEEYVLALYTNKQWLARPFARNSYYARYPAHTFCATQGMYYPELVRLGFSDYLRQEGVESFRLAYDWLLNEYLRSTGIPLFATTPCLLQHVGAISTGLSNGFHRAGCFTRTLDRGKKRTQPAQRTRNRAGAA